MDDEEEGGLVDRILDFFETDQEVDFISAPFRWDKKELFAGIEDPDTFFRSSLRSFLVGKLAIFIANFVSTIIEKFGYKFFLVFHLLSF